MAFCLCELHIWSLRNQYAIPDDVIGCHCLHDKGEFVSRSEQPYCQEKQAFVEGRDIVWTPRNKRPERLRDNIKEMEELLSQHNTVYMRWRSRLVLQLVMSNACIITLVMRDFSGDLERIYIDKSLVGKLSSEVICDAYINEQFFIASHSSMNSLDFVYFTKRPPLNEAVNRLEKLSSWEPKITRLEVPGPQGRRLERRLSMNTTEDMLLVWWSLGSGEAWPWSPVSSDKERSNCIVLSINGPNIDIMAYTKTECDPDFMLFSKLQPHRIFSLEQQLRGQEIIARSCTYEVIQRKIKTASIVNVPLKNSVVCQSRNPTEDRLLLGLSDTTLVMYDDLRKSTHFTRAAVHPASIAWHPKGALVVVASVRADFQVFDKALSPLKVHLVSEDPYPEKFLRISKFFRTSVSLQTLMWCPFPPPSSELVTNCMDALFLSFSRGPLGLLQCHLGVRSRERFSCVEIVEEYLKHQQVDEAVNLLGSMNWDVEGQACYVSLSAIINHLLRKNLNPEREAQLQATLATFYAPNPHISEAIILEYRDPIRQLARRFFQHLLRYLRFDKAFLLATDIGARDLFMDIHYLAIDKGETALAEVAKRKAEETESDILDTFQGFDDSHFLSPAPMPVNNPFKSGPNQGGSFDRHAGLGQQPWQYECQPEWEIKDDVDSLSTHSADGTFRNLDHLINDCRMNDYTTALHSSTKRLSGRGKSTDKTDQNDEDDSSGNGKVSVIRFGIV